MPTVTYRLEPDLSPEEFIDVLVHSTLAERRPGHDLDTIRAMLRNADMTRLPAQVTTDDLERVDRAWL